MKHDYKNKFDTELLNGKIVMAFTDPMDALIENDSDDIEDNYKYFTDDFTGYGVHTYYVFDTIEELIDKWEEIYNKPNGMWYWCLDDGYCFCSGACDPDDIEIFKERIKQN